MFKNSEMFRKKKYLNLGFCHGFITFMSSRGFFSLKIEMEIFFDSQLSVSSGPVLRFSSRILYPLSLYNFTLTKMADAEKSKGFCIASVAVF